MKRNAFRAKLAKNAKVKKPFLLCALGVLGVN
jgi:hypothetical protein